MNLYMVVDWGLACCHSLRGVAASRCAILAVYHFLEGIRESCWICLGNREEKVSLRMAEYKRSCKEGNQGGYAYAIELSRRAAVMYAPTASYIYSLRYNKSASALGGNGEYADCRGGWMRDLHRVRKPACMPLGLP